MAPTTPFPTTPRHPSALSQTQHLLGPQRRATIQSVPSKTPDANLLLTIHYRDEPLPEEQVVLSSQRRIRKGKNQHKGSVHLLRPCLPPIEANETERDRPGQVKTSTHKYNQVQCEHAQASLLHPSSIPSRGKKKGSRILPTAGQAEHSPEEQTILLSSRSIRRKEQKP